MIGVALFNYKKQGASCIWGAPRFFCLLVSVVFLLLFGAKPLSATQIIVSSDGTGQSTSIQAAIDMAENGDTVLILPGTYIENINYNGKTIIVASQYLLSNNTDDIFQTIIDGNMLDGVVKVISGEENGCRLVGLTIQNGLSVDSYAQGGGISVLNNSYLSIVKCRIINNTAIKGGGVQIRDSEVIIDSCIINNNKTFSGPGGGIYMTNNSNFFLTNSSIYKNFAVGGVGGIFIGPDVTGSFDSIYRNSIYLNYGSRCSDLHLFEDGNISTSLYFDTITSTDPDPYNIFCNNGYAYPVPNVLEIHYYHTAIETSNGPLYVNPQTGNNENSGLNTEEPLKNIYYALLKLRTNENNRGTIYMANGNYGNFINGESFPLQARDYTSLVGESNDNVIWDGQDTSVMIYSHPTCRSFAMKNVFIQHAGKASEGRIIVRASNNIHLENITITESNTLSWIFLSQIGFNDSSYYKNIHIFNTRGGPAFQEAQANFNDDPSYAYYENISIVNHRPVLEEEWTGAGSGFHVHGDEYVQTRTVVIKNLLLSENQYEDNIWSGASAMALSNGNYTITNATIADNLSDGPSRAVHLANGQFKIYNSIFYANETGNIQVELNSDVQIFNSLLQGGQNSIHQLSSDNVNIYYDNETNLDENPDFSEHENFFYYLLEESPCINSGTSDMPGIELPETDIIGNNRVYNGQVDMGAYEYVGPVGNNAKPIPIVKNQSSMIHIFPNPLIDYAKIEINSVVKGASKVYICNMRGAVLEEIFNTSNTKLNSIFIFENSKYHLSPGNYMIVLEVNGALVDSKQFIVVK